MSGIVKPLIHSSTSTTPTKSIPVDQVAGFASVDLPMGQILGTNRFKYLIIFAMTQDHYARQEQLEYTTAAARDSAYAALAGTTFGVNF